MATRRISAPAPTIATTSDEEATKAELQRRMDETRESIAQTVTEIKDTVSNQYETVKESVTDALDWREQFRKHMGTWSLGALSAGFLVGYSLAGAFKSTHPPARRRSGRSDFADHLMDELSGIGAMVLPALNNKIKETFGVDLSDYLSIGQDAQKSRKSTIRKRAASKGSTRRRDGTSKRSTKKASATKSASKKRATKRRNST